MKTVSTLDEIPDGAKFIVFENAKVHIAGDERSRTNPGHGYPAHDHPCVQVTCFDSLDELKRWLGGAGRYNCRVFRVEALSYSREEVVQVEISDMPRHHTA